MGPVKSVPRIPDALEGKALIEWIAEHILPLVDKPVRYIGNEPGTVHRTGKSMGDLLLMFPDVYEIGVGNVGMSLLRDTVNSAGKLRAESAYCPWPDMERLMRLAGVPLYSLESHRRASSFDVIGITVQHELSATNILTMLSLSGFPFRQSNRTPEMPYIIGGGPGVFNPEPLAEFFDLVFLGEGDDIIIDLLRIIAEGRRNKTTREHVLRETLSIDGVYIPSLYTVSRKRDGSIRRITPRSDDIPDRLRVHHNDRFSATIRRREPRISVTAPTHDRLSVEIMRGCPGGCTFCQAKRFYGRPRIKDIGTVLEEICQGVENSGIGDVSLLGLSCSDYPDIHELLDRSNSYLLPRNASLSLPSLRADSFSEEICMQLGRFRKGGFTFAPEAGSNTLRRQLGKNITNDQILQAIDTVLSHGGTGVKLYFMIGIPGETDEDIQAIIDLCREALKLIKKRHARRLAVSIATLVPKPHTPLERFSFAHMEALESKRRMICEAIRTKRAQIRWRSEEYSRLEAILSRGDRKLASVITEAWRRGARFDGWENELNIETWETALSACGASAHEYLREHSSDEVLPWSHITFRAPSGISTSSPGDDAGSITTSPMPSGDSMPRENVPTYRLRIRYSKQGLFRFLSHLDLIRIWNMLLRKSSLDITYTAGYSPRPKLSFGPALPVGFRSTCEYLDVWLSTLDDIDPEASLHAVSPDELKPFTVSSIPLHSPSLGSILKFASYSVEIPESICGAEANPVERVPEGICLEEIRGNRVNFTISLNNREVPKPREIIRDFWGIDEEMVPLVQFTRTGLWTSKPVCDPLSGNSNEIER